VPPEALLPARPDASGKVHEHVSAPLRPEELDWVQRVVGGQKK